MKDWYKVFNILKFIFFSFYILLHYIIYILFYFIYFLLKNYRFFSYFYKRFKVSKFYYNKKSIYFLFWRYLIIFIINYIYNLLYYLLYFIFLSFKKLLYCNNFYIITVLLLKLKFIILNDNLINILKNIYFLIINIFYNLFYFNNIDEVISLLKKINIFKAFIWLKDPFLYRNNYIKIFDFFFYIYTILDIKKYKMKFLYFNLLKQKILIFILYLMHLLNIFPSVKQNIFLKLLLSKILNLNKFNIKQRFILIIYYVIFLIHKILVNIIYICLLLNIYILYYIISKLYKFNKYIIYLLLLLLCVKYYWIIIYYFILLYKHYILYFPIFEIKESFRFFNFELIDFRNYYNLVLLHNTFVDLSVYIIIYIMIY